MLLRHFWYLAVKAFSHRPQTYSQCQKAATKFPPLLAAGSIYCVTQLFRHSMAQPAQIERCNKRMADSLSHGLISPRSEWSASFSSHCSLGTRWRESRTGCSAFLSKFIVIDRIRGLFLKIKPELRHQVFSTDFMHISQKDGETVQYFVRIHYAL